MFNCIKIICAEIKKYHRASFKSKKTYFTMLLWPVLVFIHTYFVYKPFYGTHITLYGFEDGKDMVNFLIVGLLTYNCFFSLVRSALFMRREREEGVLEIVILSPVNKIALIYGRALGALVQNTWMFWLFSIMLILFTNNFSWNIFELFMVYLLVCISACVWGGLMNTIFLFSRDAEIIFYLLDEPMMFFSGVKFPINTFKSIGNIIAYFFPLTYVLILARNILFGKIINEFIFLIFVLLIIYMVLMIMLTIFLLKCAEAHLMEYGNASFY